MIHQLTIIALLLGQADGELRVKAPAKPFECAYARSFRFDAGGGKRACVTQRGELLIWNGDSDDPIVTTLEKKAGGKVFDRAPMSALLTNDGREVALFYFDGRVQVWLASMGAKTKELMSDRKGLTYSCLSPDGELAAVLSRDDEARSNAILFWNTSDWTNAGAIEFADPINDFCFSPDGREVFACVGYPTDQKELGFTGIVAWSAATKKESGRIEYGSGFPIRIAVSPDGRWVAAGGGDAVPVGVGRNLSGHLRIFDWERKELVVEPYTLDTDYVRAVQFSPDGKQLYSGSFSTPPEGGEYAAAVRAFHVGDWNSPWTADLGKGNPHEISVSPNGLDLLVPTSEGLQIVDAKDGAARGSLLKFRFYPEDRNDEESP